MSDNRTSAEESAGTCVIICAYGRHSLTEKVLFDLQCAGTKRTVWIVDNGGDLVLGPDSGVEVLRPGQNLGWARGSNWALAKLLDLPYAAFVLLNNDVRLSPDFIEGLTAAWQATGADLLGPVYDHNWPHQRVSYDGQAVKYPGKPVERKVPFIDGTCMFIPRCTLEGVGVLDADFCPQWGWACDKDYSLRVRQRGGSVYVTERSYLTHLARGTASTLANFSEGVAERENDLAMAAKWGSNWRDLLYEDFPDISRIGLTQQALRADARSCFE